MIVTMTYTEIGYLLSICEKDMEEDAIRFLSHSLSKKYKEALRKSDERKAIIRTAKAINRGRNKGIAALCDIDS